MKLVKLSLAAAVAAGALAMSASAVPLEEAIKDVDLNGYARIRYTHDKKSYENDQGNYIKGENSSKWQFKSEVDFKAKVDDNFFGVVGVRFMDEDNGETFSSSNSQYHRDKNANDGDSDFDIAKAYLGYTIGGTTIAVGRQGIGSFFTDDMYGDGVKITSTDIEGLTITGFWMDSLENDGDISSLDWGRIDGKLTTDHNLYGIGFMGSYDPVSFQLWYNALEDVTQLFAAELALNFDISDDFNLGVKG
uniref:major outer membrane protein n=1 Tax=uncultured Campylobacter sp. TaxID=218934 RepID=UPI00260CB6F5